MADYRLSPRAQRDLDEIFDYTVAQWGLEQALTYTDRLAAACAQLAEAPMLAPSAAHIRADYRRWRVDHHMIYFRVARSGIDVVRILHERMDVLRSDLS